MRSLIIAIIAIAAGYFYIQYQQADRDETGAVVSEGAIDAFQIQVGDCFNDAPDQGKEDTIQVFDVAGIPCSQPHDNEVYAIFDAALAEFPGSDEMSNLAHEACVERFEAFVGRDYETSKLDVYPMYPTIESWNQRDDREIVCALYDPDLAKLTGSMRGTGI
jgi:hypothetical protein